jgi:hypothetical protein
LVAPVVATVVLSVAMPLVVAPISVAFRSLAPLRMAVVSVLALVGVRLWAPVLIAVFSELLLLLLLPFVAVSLAAFGRLCWGRLQSIRVVRVLRLRGVRCVSALKGRRADRFRLLRVRSDRQRRRASLLLHLLGNVERHVNRIGLPDSL